MPSLIQNGARQPFVPERTLMVLASEALTPTMTTTPNASAPGDPRAQPPGAELGRTTTVVLVAFAAVYIIWGPTYLAIRIGVESFPPLLLAGCRHLIFGALLYPWLRWKTGVRPSRAQWRTAAVSGCLLLFAGNGVVCVAEKTVPSGIAALLVATVS